MRHPTPTVQRGTTVPTMTFLALDEPVSISAASRSQVVGA
jgi:hypothetical protein